MIALPVTGVGQTRIYPLPRAKPPGAVVYPLPPENPLRILQQRDIEQPEPELSEHKKETKAPRKRKKKRTRPGSRAAEAEDDATLQEREWTPDEVATARRECATLLADIAIEYETAEPIGGPGACGVAAPVKISAFGAPQSVAVEPMHAVINCKMAAATVKWLETKVQPAARELLGEPVVKIRNAASYACRRRNNKPDGKLSEHALGNALDVSIFTLESGKTVSVLDDWVSEKNESIIDEVMSAIGRDPTPESRFLQKVHAGACEVFSTIIGPDGDKYHANHFHFDLGRGGRYLVCR